MGKTALPERGGAAFFAPKPLYNEAPCVYAAQIKMPRLSPLFTVRNSGKMHGEYRERPVCFAK